MKTVRHFQLLLAAPAALCLTACSGIEFAHVRPGQSARAAIAARNAQPASPEDLPAPETRTAALHPNSTLPSIDAVPALPTDGARKPKDSATAESVADAYTRGTFAMQAGQNAEAIAAFEEAVKLVPDFTDAWGKLAILYQKDGDTAKATDAFKKAKRLGDANGGTVTRDAAGGLQLP